VRVVIGPQASSEVGAVRRAAANLGVVVISQGSTAHSLAFADDNVLRFVTDDVREGEALVALLRRDRIDAIVPV
jgi:branched-chain amino acid transport system substrate-binding protein